MDSLLALGGGALVGIAIHHGLFIHGEWHVQAPNILLGHLLAFALLHAFLDSVIFLSIITGYLSALISSITIYRVFFHPLRRFPGPLGARITKLWHVWQVRDSRNYRVLDDLHTQYGDFVRTGPNELTIFHPDIFLTIDGPKSTCIKAEWYDLLHPKLSLVTSRDKSTHAARRRQWNRGFTSKSLDQYITKILPYITQLEHRINHDIQNNHISNVTDLFYWFGFDTMGDFVFNKSFDMLHRNEWHFVVVLLRRAMSILGPLSPVPWFVQIAFKLFPRVWILGDWFRMVAWCEGQMRERMELPEDKTPIPDVAHHLLLAAKSTPEDFPWLSGDSILAIVAGSEPTATTLIGIFCELARSPHLAETIYHELETVDICDPRAIAKECPFLEAVISEALRLYPALPTGGNRKTCEEVFVGDVVVPRGTTVVAPRWSVFRREDCFERPDEFIPERWYGRTEMVRNKAAYAPFGTGHHSCVGRFLAMDDMRLVTARLVKKYHLRLPEGETGECVLGDLRDQFTATPGRLRVRFEVRGG
ncbi:benzoate 4-monooxygenase cytochrome P450 [Aspergillus sclerotioniger CBS 115572]|uniref:Benzoate 4-monooxygenase cytochrome P450 n=1 Tax=Aspergillus sclerotioniger CBS 115572 TaxID=1450535 RepID=A0A317XDP8_9EURO|nr:benzoate 4-monooxygenase cytochrome P450 [Aspergillus sclerotioniger CBS 115572]PWY96633.1 benzoate 4-monooxygenase cytochrome P450 [Aspergillus sclerotioniger CBS 115572]